MRTRLAILFGIPLLVLVAMSLFYWNRWAGPEVEPGSTLVVDLGGRYIEGDEPPLFAKALGDDSRPITGVLSTLGKARRDDRIDRVVLRIRRLGIGWGKAQELHDAIARVREAGRHTVAYLELASLGANREYYVASAADEIYLVPGASVPLVGLVAQYLFVSELAEKVGIGFDVTKAGRYKSATEIFTERELSPASYEMASALLDSTEAQFVRGIAAGRGLSEEQVRGAIDSGPVLASQLEGFDLIDGVAHLEHILGEASVIWDRDYREVDAASLGFSPEANLALIHGTGNVVMQGSGGPGADSVFGAASASQALRAAAADPAIDAILLRIDSPGGSSVAAEVIWAAVQHARSRKPVVASFSDLAASGGYYVAAGASAIVSQPGTLTGSIGVFAVRPVDRGLQDKLGVRFQALERGRHADLLVPYRAVDDESSGKLQDLVVAVYDLFLERVAVGRGMHPSDVDAIAQGRVWTGEQAHRHGLVDALGGFNVAIGKALELLGLDPEADASVIPYRPARPLFEELIGRLLQAGSGLASYQAWRLSPGSRVHSVLLEPLAAAERFLRSWPGEGTAMWLPVVIDIH